MAKDDYQAIVFKILVYLYGCLQRKYSFSEAGFNAAVSRDKIADEYLTDILRNMQDEGLIKGLTFAHAWGNEYLLANEFSDAIITSKGIDFLKENDRMRQIAKMFLEGAGMITELVKLVLSIG